jgi:hypothetical protein
MVSTLEFVDRTASRQWSLVTRRQLLDGGITAHKIAGLLDSGALRRVGYRVYATVGSPRSWEQAVLAAVLSAGPKAVASHAAAARLWNFSCLPMDAIDVTVECDLASGFSLRRRGVHRTLALPEADVAERSGIPCTSFERTLCDCTAGLSPFQLGRVLDDGMRRHVASLERLRTCLLRLDSGPGRRLRSVQRLLAERDDSFDPGGSASELRVLKVPQEAGLPTPVQQLRVHVNSHAYELDFAWPEQRVFAEYYGLPIHSAASAVAYDSSRLTAMVAEGWRPLVFTDATPDDEMVRCAEKVLAIDQSHW